jgi:hypothetical protein
VCPHAPTTIRHMAFEIGKEAASIFLDEREFDLENFTPKTKVPETLLIEKGSKVVNTR